MRLKLRLCEFVLHNLSWTEKISARSIAANDRLHFILGMHCKRNAQHWFFEIWMPHVRQLYHRLKLYDGNIIHVIPESIQFSTALMFSVLVSGRGKSGTCMWAIARLDWLSLELMVHAQHILESNGSQVIQNIWSNLELLLKCKRWDIQLDSMWSLHKVEFNGENIELTVPNVNRSDVMLLAWPRQDVEPTAIASVYYSILVTDTTASETSRQIYIHSRLIWRDCILAGVLPNLAVQLLARAFNAPEDITITDNVPVIPADFEHPSDVATLNIDYANTFTAVDKCKP